MYAVNALAQLVSDNMRYEDFPLGFVRRALQHVVETDYLFAQLLNQSELQLGPIWEKDDASNFELLVGLSGQADSNYLKSRKVYFVIKGMGCDAKSSSEI